jgi:hypothetical protein
MDLSSYAIDAKLFPFETLKLEFRRFQVCICFCVNLAEAWWIVPIVNRFKTQSNYVIWIKN